MRKPAAMNSGLFYIFSLPAGEPLYPLSLWERARVRALLVVIASEAKQSGCIATAIHKYSPLPLRERARERGESESPPAILEKL